MSLDLRGTCSVAAMPSRKSLRGRRRRDQHVLAPLRGAARITYQRAARILSLTRALAGAYAKHNLRVNAICSGRVHRTHYRTLRQYASRLARFLTARMPPRVRDYLFCGQPEDIARLRCSSPDESRMITGAGIPADGGRSAYEQALAILTGEPMSRQCSPSISTPCPASSRAA